MLYEKKVWLLCIGGDSGGGALQLHPDDPHHPGALRLRIHGRQRGHLRHLPQEQTTKTHFKRRRSKLLGFHT